MSRRYRTDELDAMPTIDVGWTANLKIDTGTRRIWLERTGIADGEPVENKVTHEHLIDGRWVSVLMYSGDDPDTTIEP